MTTPGPYDSPAEWMDDQVEIIRATIAVNSLTRRLRDAIEEAVGGQDPPRHRHGGGTVAETRARLHQANEKLHALQTAHQERLAVHRGSDRIQLPIDKMCEEHGLSDEERQIITTAAIPAVGGRQMAEHVLGNADHYCGSMATGELVDHILAPKTVADCIRYRRFFHRDAPLVAGGLLWVDQPYRDATGESLLNCGVAITVSGLARLLGEPSIASEGVAGDDEPAVPCG